MAYAPPPGNITGTAGIFSWINSSIHGLFFVGIIVAVFIIITIKLMFSTDDIGKSFAAASFICMILTVLLRVADLVNTSFMVIFIMLTAISAIWMHVENLR